MMNTNDSNKAGESRKEYFPPKILYTEKMEARALTCLQGTDAQCGAGPIQS